MIKFNKPAKLDGTQLVKEIKSAGIEINQPPLIDEVGDFWLDVKDKDKTKVAGIVDNHIAVEIDEKALEKAKAALFDRLGITADEAKLLLSQHNLREQ